VDRERDERGRPLNARPRDGLGRPLPRDEQGVDRVPPTLVLAPVESLVEAQRLLDEDLPFHAHEVLEGTWKAAPDDERELWQGLAQLAVGITHARRGNRPGAAALLRRGRDRIEPYRGAPPYGIDVDGLLGWSDDAIRDLTRTDPGAGSAPGSNAPGDEPIPSPPRLRRSSGA
jgi:uncharacterized protein